MVKRRPRGSVHGPGARDPVSKQDILKKGSEQMEPNGSQHRARSQPCQGDHRSSSPRTAKIIKLSNYQIINLPPGWRHRPRPRNKITKSSTYPRLRVGIPTRRNKADHQIVCFFITPPRGEEPPTPKLSNYQIIKLSNYRIIRFSICQII